MATSKQMGFGRYRYFDGVQFALCFHRSPHIATKEFRDRATFHYRKKGFRVRWVEARKSNSPRQENRWGFYFRPTDETLLRNYGLR